LPGLALNHSPPDLCLLIARIIGMSHWCPTIYLVFVLSAVLGGEIRSLCLLGNCSTYLSHVPSLFGF
jgi:hypothetical protein